MIKKALMLTAACLSFAIICPALPAEENECELFWINGSVTETNWVGSRFSVRRDDQYFDLGLPDELLFHVNDRTEFIRGTKQVPFSSLNINDKVSVMFCFNDFAEPVARKVIIQRP